MLRVSFVLNFVSPSKFAPSSSQVRLWFVPKKTNLGRGKPAGRGNRKPSALRSGSFRRWGTSGVDGRTALAFFHEKKALSCFSMNIILILRRKSGCTPCILKESYITLGNSTRAAARRESNGTALFPCLHLQIHICVPSCRITKNAGAAKVCPVKVVYADGFVL